MLPDFGGHFIEICFPSIAPMQFGKFHLIKVLAACFISSMPKEGISSFNPIQIATHTSSIIRPKCCLLMR